MNDALKPDPPTFEPPRQLGTIRPAASPLFGLDEFECAEP
jgi:hypothetical protein